MSMVIIQAKDNDDLDQSFMSQGGEVLAKYWIYLEGRAVSGFDAGCKNERSQRWCGAKMTGEDNRMSLAKKLVTF